MLLNKKKKDEDAKPIEQEIAELQRKFRLLENDKRACSEDSQALIRKQRATIEKLTRENRKMKGELKETRANTGSQAENRMALETIGNLSDQKEKLSAKLDAEVEAGSALDLSLGSTNQQIFTLRGDMAKNGGVNASLDNAKAVQKQIRILENRLDKAAVKFNEAIAANKGLREQIDTLRRERVVFDDIYRKLENELQQKKREMANIIEQANAAYEARDQAQAQMASLKQQADREHLEFEREWKELGKLIANDKSMKEYMKNMVRAAKAPQGDGAKEDNRERKRMTKNAWDTVKSVATASASAEKVTTYEEAFARIQAATGICDLEELVSNFIHAEDTNFSLFKYNNELRTDIEKLELQISDYKDEFVALSGSGGKKEDTERVKLLESLEERWNDIDKKAIHYDVRYQESRQTLSHVRRGIESIFKRVGCTDDDLPCGSGSAVTEANMMAYLAAIESKAIDHLNVYAALGGEDEAETSRARPGAAAASLQVNKLPSTVEDHSDEEDDDEEEDSRPFTVEELKAKTRLRAKRAQAKGKPKGRG